MKIDCGLTRKTKRKRAAEPGRVLFNKLFQWHRCFFWFPTRIGDNDCRWLEYGERRAIYVKLRGDIKFASSFTEVRGVHDWKVKWNLQDLGIYGARPTYQYRATDGEGGWIEGPR